MAVKCRRERYHCMSGLSWSSCELFMVSSLQTPTWLQPAGHFLPYPVRYLRTAVTTNSGSALGGDKSTASASLKQSLPMPSHIEMGQLWRAHRSTAPGKSLSTHNLLDWQTPLGSFRYGQNHKPQEWLILWVHWYQVWLINISHKKYPPVTTECPQCLGSL